MRVQIGKSALGVEGPAVRVARTTTSGQRWKRPAPVTYQMVRAHIAPLRRTPAGAAPRPPSVRQVTGWLTRHPTALTEED